MSHQSNVRVGQLLGERPELELELAWRTRYWDWRIGTSRHLVYLDGGHEGDVNSILIARPLQSARGCLRLCRTEARGVSTCTVTSPDANHHALAMIDS
jgi:hypothetical protein